MADAIDDTPVDALEELGRLSRQAAALRQQLALAHDVPALQRAALQIPPLVAQLHRSGCTVVPIAAIVQALNTGLFQRTWQVVAPPGLVAGSCLFVMGSEGRGEQILKTDQDNGLVLRSGTAGDDDALEQACSAFSQALRSFGYPDCPGGIMVSRPAWRQDAAAFSRTARRWLAMPDAEGLMNLAIFLDARPVSGDPALLEQVRDAVFELAAGSDAMLARFAAAIDTFSESVGWWNRWLPHADPGRAALDLKKLGLFPLVHGVRSLALEQRVRTTGTVARVQALQATGVLAPALARDIIDSLHCFMTLRLNRGLSALPADGAAGAAYNAVVPAQLATLEHRLLDAALDVVKQFRALLRQHFHLDALS